MKKRPSLPQLSGREIRLGLLYLLSELLVIPPIIYGIGDLLGGFSPAFANFLYYLCNAGFCLLIFRELLAQSLRQAGSRPLRFLLAALVGFAGFELSTELNQLLLRYLAPDFFNVNDASLRGMILEAPALLLLGTVVLAPVAEECLFRGLLFLPLRQKSPWLGYAVSSLCFCAVHVIGYWGAYPAGTLLLCFFQYLPAGLLLAWALDYSGSLFAPMLIHSAVNLLSFLSMR